MERYVSSARDALVVCAFLTVCGLLMTDPLLRIAAMFPPRLAAFSVAVTLSWLAVDNITLAFDLAAAQPQTTTPAESIILRRLRTVTQHIHLVLAQLDDEMVAHGKTAMRLDELEDRIRKGALTALHWSLLASKVAVIERVERMASRRVERGGAVRRGVRHRTTDDC
jgi:hypothetical protein